jgi:RecA-family ATPase
MNSDDPPWDARNDDPDPIMPPPSEEWQRAHPGWEDPKRWKNGKRPNGEDHELPQVEWRDERLSDWADRIVPDRRWIIPDWIPRDQVTGIYGTSGINKTDFFVQLLMARAAGLVFIGYQLEPGPVYGLFCEDTREEIFRRASRIAAHYGRSLADFPDFHFASLVGLDDPEFMSFDGNRMAVGAALLRFDRKIVELGATLATLDTVAHFFGGSEVVRREVTKFIRKLDAISIVRGAAIVFSAHPSVRGRASGTMESGSTGWEAGVRARNSIHDPGIEDDEGPAPKLGTDRRILTRQNSNYARPGETIELVWRDGVFTTAALDPEQAAKRQRGPGRDAACEERFFELLTKIGAQGEYVQTIKTSPRYAPRVFVGRPDGKTFSEAEYSRAMQRLFVSNRLRVEPFGPPSRCKTKLVEVQL